MPAGTDISPHVPPIGAGGPGDLAPTPPPEGPHAELDAVLWEVQRLLGEIWADLLAVLDSYIQAIQDDVGGVIADVVRRIDADLQDVKETIEAALDRIDAGVNTTLYEAWFAAHAAGADISIDGFPADVVARFGTVPTQDSMPPLAGPNGLPPFVPVAEEIPVEEPPPPPGRRKRRLPEGPGDQPPGPFDVQGGPELPQLPELPAAEVEISHVMPPECCPPVVTETKGPEPEPRVPTQIPEPVTDDFEFVALQEPEEEEEEEKEVVPAGGGGGDVSPLVCMVTGMTEGEVREERERMSQADDLGEPGPRSVETTPGGYPYVQVAFTWPSLHMPIVDDKAVGDNWCARAQKVYPHAVTVGKLALAGGANLECGLAMSKDAVKAMGWRFFGDHPGVDWGEAVERLYRGLSIKVLCSVTEAWAEVFENVNAGGVNEYFALAACRQILLTLAEVDVQASMSLARGEDVTKEVTYEGGLGFMPSLAGVHAGAATKKKETAHSTQSRSGLAHVDIKVRVFLVPLIAAVEYLINTAEMGESLTAAEALDCYLGGAIDECEYLCYSAMRGRPKGDARRVAWARRSKLGPNEIIGAYRRDMIGETDLRVGLRDMGFMTTQERKILYELSWQVPPMGDLIRFMVRDVEDPKILSRFGLDEEFTDKWRGSLPKLGEAQGISEDLARLHWRAHWRLPGLHQAYECLHRLRPDNCEGYDKSIFTTVDDVKALLGQDDVLPFWRERLIAISYHPLTRVDARRMLISGAISRDEFICATQDQGYTLANAVRLADWVQQLRIQAIEKDRACKLFVEGVLSEDELRLRLDRYKVTVPEWLDLLPRLQKQVWARTTAVCLKATRLRYLSGEIDTDGAKNELLARQMPYMQVDSIVNGWYCEREARAKTIPASTLCQWFALNLITEADFRTRLIRLGYSGVDAARILSACTEGPVKRLRERTERSESKRQEDLKKAMAKMAAEKDNAAKAAARVERTRDREAAAEARRKKKLRLAAEHLAEALPISLITAADMVAAGTAYLMREHHLTQTEAEAVVIDAARVYDASWGIDWTEALDVLARIEEAFDAPPAVNGSAAGGAAVMPKVR